MSDSKRRSPDVKRALAISALNKALRKDLDPSEFCLKLDDVGFVCLHPVGHSGDCGVPDDPPLKH